MRRTSLAPLALAFLFTAGAAEAQTLKIGYINSAEIVNEAPGASEAQAQFDAELQASQDEITRFENELTNMEQALQQQALTLSPEAKANREQQFQMKVQEYQDRVQQLQTSANSRRAQLVQPIMDEITAVIETIREEGNYALILDAAAGSIISADPSLDLTQEVLRRLVAAAAAAPGGLN
ncbi:MAG: OmpH family outer membrane protein [Gemmatimonadales bacterium]|jgi:outer membrane protein|nr:OmpH family outer membrane protein [Gemmatimonadales bacterium]MDG2239035.1 OmpH family outer membrane protein [Longimicrobiales bacterium]MBT3500375.1 OmpH family outer membrane protein [Gemmatimonadales bacterium]MBT3774581.1 OmpH family outer membrane protein [Gemmatimonadales bacterium]MBT3958180.1 OmpH family outer membrane protein [Gemmatimonadales bacterium]